MAYLDDTGVTTLTSEIKSYIDDYYLTTKIGSITLDDADWTGNGPWTQVVSFSGETITANTMVNLSASVATIAQLQENDITEIIAKNDNGTVTIYCRGRRAPKADITLQYSLLYVSNTSHIAIFGDPIVVSNLDYFEFDESEFTDNDSVVSSKSISNGMISNGWVMITLSYVLKALTSGTQYELTYISDDLYKKIGRTWREFTGIAGNSIIVKIVFDTWYVDSSTDEPLKRIMITPTAAISSGTNFNSTFVLPVSYNI